MRAKRQGPGNNEWTDSLRCQENIVQDEFDLFNFGRIGKTYFKQEVFSPGRVLTTTVKTDNPEAPLLPVRSDKLIPKDRLTECMKVIAEHTARGPIHLGQVVIDNILDLNINIIASRSTSP